MDTSLIAIKEESDEYSVGSSVKGSVKGNIEIFKSRVIQQNDPLILSQESSSSSSNSSVESLTSSSDSSENKETDHKLAFLANKNIRNTLRIVSKKKIQIKSRKRRETLLFEAFERKSVLANNMLKIHSKAINRIFEPKTKISHDAPSIRLKQLSIILFSLVLTNIFINIIDIETFKANLAVLLEESQKLSYAETISLVEQRDMSTSELFLRVFSAFLSLLQILVLTAYYINSLKLGKMNRKYSVIDTIYSTGLWKGYYSEIAILAISPSVYGDFYLRLSTSEGVSLYSTNSLLNILSFLKLYTAIRAYKNTGKWYKQVSRNICTNSDVTFTAFLALKAEFNKTVKPFLFLSASLIAMLSYIFSVLTFLKVSRENLIQAENSSLIASFYFLVNSFCSVGTGDLVPKDVISRCFTVLSAFLGILFSSLLIATLNLSLTFTPEEKNAFQTLKRLDAMEKVENKATVVIFAVLTFSKTKNEKESQNASRICSLFVELAVIKRNISYYLKAKNDRKHIDLPVEQNIISFENDLKGRLDRLSGNIELLSRFTERLKEDYREIFKIQGKVKNLIYQQNKLGEGLEQS